MKAYWHNLKAKIADVAGETLVEALAAILILTLASAFFLQSATTATGINKKARTAGDIYRKSVVYAEKTWPATQKDKIKITGSKTKDVDVYFNETTVEKGLRSYRLSPSAVSASDNEGSEGD